jgi:Zn-dependent peptidase ImmA (M78 family)
MPLSLRNILNLRPHNLKRFRREKKSLKEMAKLCGISVSQLYVRLHELGLIKKIKKRI